MMKTILVLSGLVMTLVAGFMKSPHLLGLSVWVSSLVMALVLMMMGNVLLGFSVILAFSSGIMIIFLFSSALSLFAKYKAKIIMKIKSAGFKLFSKVVLVSLCFGGGWLAWQLGYIDKSFTDGVGVNLNLISVELNRINNMSWADFSVGVIEELVSMKKKTSFGSLEAGVVMLLGYLLVVTVFTVVSLCKKLFGRSVGKKK
uniref:NADH dehydrogenase subunit 6 n=1 Tax=Hiatella arctica TaxID=120431 RepID=Q06SB3_9BIVA|nr:NADH dehydrogenase subunit 6 [Hiatella arctica]